MNCTNLAGIIDNAAPYVIFGIVVLGFVAIIRAIKGDD